VNLADPVPGKTPRKPSLRVTLVSNTPGASMSDEVAAERPPAARVRMNDANSASASVPVQRKLTKADGGGLPPPCAAGPDDGLCAVPADPGLLPFRDGLYGDPCGRGGFFVDGWLAQGFTANFDGPANNFNLPVTFNDRANEYQLNQLYVTAGRRTDPELGHGQLGGRIDLLYGTDCFFTTALGLETNQDGSPKWNSADGPRGEGAALYGLAMPQVYAEVFAPVGSGLTVKLGHFYTILGVESVMAPENFFYSRAYAKQYGEPFTHTGLLADYRPSPEWTVQAGFTRGWNNWEDNNDRLGFLGGADWTSPDERTTVAFALHTGSEDAAGEYNRTVYSLVVERKITCRLTYIFQHDFGVEDGARIARDGSRDSAKWYGLNQYLIYRAGEEVDLGLRLEWFRDQDNARVLRIPIEPLVGGGNYFALTAGMNWKPRSWVTAL